MKVKKKQLDTMNVKKTPRTTIVLLCDLKPSGVTFPEKERIMFHYDSHLDYPRFGLLL